jgi:hypothetical protein
VLAFGLGCRTTKDECIDAWSTGRIESATESFESILLMMEGRVVDWSIMDRSAEVELQLCACHGDNPCKEPPLYDNDDQL